MGGVVDYGMEGGVEDGKEEKNGRRCEEVR